MFLYKEKSKIFMDKLKNIYSLREEYYTVFCATKINVKIRQEF